MGSTFDTAHWEREEQRAVENSYDYNPDPPRGSLDDPMGPSVLDLR
ncbi:hypothetical protein [Nocardia salmonicida]